MIPTHAKRIHALIDTKSPGNQLICLAAIHGNEVAGLTATNNISTRLSTDCRLENGRMVILNGNIKAVEKGVRYIHKDLNRLWSETIINHAYTLSESNRTEEETELIQLYETIKNLTCDYRGNTLLLDLHTTSAKGGAFSIIPGNHESYQLAKKLGVPVIKDVEKVLKTTVMSYYNSKGIPGMAFEAGQHIDPASAEIMEAAIWVALDHLSMISSNPSNRLHKAQEILKNASYHGMPPEVRFLYRHHVSPEDGFRMKPGFLNFDPVKEGQVLAHDKTGQIVSPYSGLLLMPLYQSQGEDGFFIVEEQAIHPL